MNMRSIAQAGFLRYGMYGLLIAFMYYPSYSWLVGHDWPREDYNYCYLVPFVVFYLIWEKRYRWSTEASAPSWGGLLFLLPGIVLFWAGELAGEFFSLYISSWLMVVGILWTHEGWKKIRIMSFPILVSLFLFPLPHFINTKLTFNLKLISSELGIKIIQFFGMSAYREGNVIDLGLTQLQVVDACSGLRYLIPLFLMGVLTAYYYRAACWKRIIVASSTIPLSIVMNSLRIAVTAFLYPSLGPSAAEGFFHDFSGWVIFMVSFGVLLAEIWILRRMLPRSDEHFLLMKDVASDESKCPGQAGTNDLAAKKNEGIPFHQPQFVVAFVILALTVGIHASVDFREKQPVSRPFSEFPLLIGRWEGMRQSLDRQFLDVLELTDYTVINYEKPDTPAVNFYVAYYESQRKGKSIHSPETCLPGSGWCFRQAGTVTMHSNGEKKPFSVMRALMEKDEHKELVYYWFSERGRIMTNAYQMKVYNLWDALIKKRTDGALIRVITPVLSSEKVEDADARLQSFIKEITPTLNEFIPGSAI
jgi:exosortase D (VPLPA-CTERM-specific)